MRVALHKSAPFEIAWHSNWAIAELFDRVVLFIGIALHNAGQGVVGLLDFTDNDRLEFTARVLEVEVGLWMLAVVDVFMGTD